MKICPNCGKSNPDNSKKCFYCSFDIQEVAVYIPEPIQDIKEAEIEDFEDYEIIETPIEENKPKKDYLAKLKQIKFTKKPAQYFIGIFAPIFSVLIFLISVFTCVVFIVYNAKTNVLLGVLYGLISLGIGCFLSIITLWFSATMNIFKKK